MIINFKSRYTSTFNDICRLLYFHFYDIKNLQHLFTKRLVKQFNCKKNDYEFCRISSYSLKYTPLYLQNFICLLTDTYLPYRGRLMYRVEIRDDRLFPPVLINEYYKDDRRDYLLYNYRTIYNIDSEVRYEDYIISVSEIQQVFQALKSIFNMQNLLINL